jgi:hypothetical protein
VTKNNDKDLRDLLAQLHARLGHAASVDADSRKLLQTVSNDIEKTLARRSGKGPGAHESRLKELAVRFETEHPALAEAVRDVMDALGKAGI